MPTLTVRDIPGPVYDRLKERAGRHRRSLSGEIVTLLEERLLPQPLDTEALIAEVEPSTPGSPSRCPTSSPRASAPAGSTRMIWRAAI